MSNEFDPDEDAENVMSYVEVDRLVAKLQDCDLSEWDQDFVENLAERLGRYGSRTHISDLQYEQLERMRGDYKCN